jgi:hypothetical protein
MPAEGLLNVCSNPAHRAMQAARNAVRFVADVVADVVHFLRMDSAENAVHPLMEPWDTLIRESCRFRR